MSNPVSKFIRCLLTKIEYILKLPLSTYPKYPNKLQVSALIFFFKCFPLLPPAPVSWNSKKRSIVTFKNKLQKYSYVAWLFLFDFVIGVVSPCYLLYYEFGTNKDKRNPIKMGMKKSTFQILFAVGTFCSVCYSIFAWIIPAKDICHDYKVVARFANYLHYGRSSKIANRKTKRQVDIMGIMTHLNGIGFINSSYLAPIMTLYYRMDPVWNIFVGLFPSCVLDSGRIQNDHFCHLLFYGLRPGLIHAWIMSAGRTMGGSVFFAWIFFEMFNVCIKMLHDLKPEKGMHLYWVYWKVYVGVKYWVKAGLAIGIYGGIWLVTVCLYASLVIIPMANPLTFVYATFPLAGLIAILAFMCLPYVLQFPILSRSLINKWRYEAGIQGHSFKGKVMRREVRAMQPITVRVGNFFNLDKSIVVVVTTAIVDQTVDLIMSLNKI